MNLILLVALLQSPKSVYHISPPLDITIAVGAVVGSSLAYLNSDNLITPRCPCDPNEVNAFDRGAIGNTSPTAAKLSDVTVVAVLVAPLAIDAVNLGGFHHVWWEDAVVFAQTLAINGALMTTAKFVVQRPLPRTYAGDPSLIDRPEGYRSFYSGHTSTVFAGLAATAMTMRLRYGEKTWPWIVTGVVGTSVAVERVADGRHFPTDVIAGAIMGTAVGIVVPRLHARGGSGGLQALPGSEGGFLVGWQLQF